VLSTTGINFLRPTLDSPDTLILNTTLCYPNTYAGITISVHNYNFTAVLFGAYIVMMQSDITQHSNLAESFTW